MQRYFPPEMWTSMTQSLGPITMLLNYIKSEKQYLRNVRLLRNEFKFTFRISTSWCWPGTFSEIHDIINLMGGIDCNPWAGNKGVPLADIFFYFFNESSKIHERHRLFKKWCFRFLQNASRKMGTLWLQKKKKQIVYRSTFGTHK